MHGAPRAPRDRRYSTNAWRKVRELVRERDERTCQACGRHEPVGGRKTFPVDHKYPGGDFYDPEGLWLLCWSCNTSKSGMSVDEWKARAERPVGGKPSSVVAYRPRLEFGTTDELARIRAAIDDHNRADKLAWPLVGGPPSDHGHPRHAARHLVTIGRENWEVCPPGCLSPARWRWRSAT